VRAAHVSLVVVVRDVLGIQRRSGTSVILLICTKSRGRIDVGVQASVATSAARRDAGRLEYRFGNVLSPLLASNLLEVRGR
jgi:hypothetical protein